MRINNRYSLEMVNCVGLGSGDLLSSSSFSLCPLCDLEQVLMISEPRLLVSELDVILPTSTGVFERH